MANGQIGVEDPTVAELLGRWLEHVEDVGRSPATLSNYRRYVTKELVPVIGSVRLSKLTAGHLDRLYSALRRRGLAPATIRQIHAIMRAVLHQAVRWGLVSRNVASLASAPCGGARPAVSVERRRSGRWMADRAAQPSGAAGCRGRPPDQDPLGAYRNARPCDGGSAQVGVAGGPPAGPLRQRRGHPSGPGTSSASTLTALQRGAVTRSAPAGFALPALLGSPASVCTTYATGRRPSCSTPGFPSRRWLLGSDMPMGRRR